MDKKTPFNIFPIDMSFVEWACKVQNGELPFWNPSIYMKLTPPTLPDLKSIGTSKVNELKGSFLIWRNYASKNYWLYNGF